MNILVTGASGFIGSAIASKLKSEHEVIAASRSGTAADGTRGLKWDITEEIPAELDGTEIDVIVHAAASLSMDDMSPEAVMTNCVGTYNVFNLAVSKKVKRIVYISSLPVIGKPNGVITADTPPAPLSIYHASKAAGEMIVKQAERYGIGYVTLRVPSPVGVGMPEKTILSVMIKRALANEPLVIYGKGTRRQNYIDVRDIACAVSGAAVAEHIENGIYNLASDRTYSNNEVAELCRRVTGSTSVIEHADKNDPYDDWDYTADTKKLENAIGPYLLHDLEDTVRHTAGSFAGSAG
ncbi:MAG: NAD(P)-dependent oxidoreductase [Lachnospiraceae bacterium]|nr:NAD(P)-dependent oxidoreductase [Lachnospiraceae bacterium]